MSKHPVRQKRLLTAAEIEVRIWAIVVLMITSILLFIVVSLIYRTTFVTQPIKQISPMDLADQKMLNDIVLLLVGVVGGVAARKGVKEAAEMIAAVQKPVLPTFPTPTPYGMSAMPPIYGAPTAYTPPPPPVVVDVNWTPPPPPSNPPHHLEDPDERQAMAAARESTRGT